MAFVRISEGFKSPKRPEAANLEQSTQSELKQRIGESPRASKEALATELGLSTGRGVKQSIRKGLESLSEP